MQERKSPYQIAAIVGICKNAGKTTILNHIIAQDPRCRYGLMSTGIDGEDFDLVYGTQKPKVKLSQGSLLICDQETADSSGSGLKILSQAPGTSGRKLLVAEAAEDIETKITGPGSVDEQIRCAKALLAEGADSVLIDGSLDRKSIALSEVVEHLILAIGAAYGSGETVQKELNRLMLLNSLEPDPLLSKTVRSRLLESRELCLLESGKWRKTTHETLFGAEQSFVELLQNQGSEYTSYIPGAFTETSFAKLKPFLKSANAKLIFRHPESIKLSLLQLKELLSIARIRVLIPFRIKEFYLNTWSPGINQRDADSFRSLIRESFPELNFIDLWELI
ncbi:MAG: hypothetical protein V3576_08640 [Candidatus Cloacimonadota bacterium]